MKHKNKHNRMKLPHRAFSPRTQRQLIQHPTPPDPKRHQRRNAQTRRYRRALEIQRLSIRIVRHIIRRDIEASQPQQTAERKVGEKQVVEVRAHAEGEGGDGGRGAEGDQVGQAVELLAHETGLAAPARDFAVHEVEEEAEGHEGEGGPEVGMVGGRAEAVA